MQTKNMQTIANGGSGDRASGDGFLTRPGLAVALQVSVCTVDRMANNGEIPRVRVRRRVRFYLPDVVEALRKGNQKYGRKAALAGNPEPEIRIPLGDAVCREKKQEAQKP